MSATLLLFATLFLCTATPGNVSASEAGLCGGISVLGRSGCHGYFTNTYFYGTYGIQGTNVLDCTQAGSGGCVNGESTNNAIPSNIDTIPEFEAFIENYLGNSSTYNYNRAGAAFIIDTMLPGVPKFSSITTGISYARSHVTDWERQLSQDRLVSQTTTIPKGTIDSLHACTTNESNCTPGNVASHDGKDFMFYRRQDSQSSHLMRFIHPDGTEFDIRRECANLVRDLNPGKTVPPVQAPACDGYSVNPANLDPNTPYKVTVHIRYKSSADATLANAADNLFLKITGPGVAYNNANAPVTQSGSVLTSTVSLGPTGNLGRYQIQWGTTGSQAPISCGGATATFEVADRPYFSVEGGDIAAGSGFESDSCTTASADINGWNTNSDGSPSYAGAGSYLAALATGHITNFVSGLGLSGGAAAHDGYGLSLANTLGTGAGQYGGQFGSGALPCVPDHYAAMPAGAAVTGAQFNGGDLPGTAGTYSFKANAGKAPNFTLHLASSGVMTVPAGYTINLYVHGNVAIEHNLVYGSYNLGNVPRFNLYVEGNIYVAPSVTELHGVYVAQGSAAGSGIFNSCATVSGATVTTTQSYGSCNKQLRVVGAVAAEGALQLTRTYGSVTAAAGVPAAPAEIFQSGPELWLTGSQNNTFDVKTYSSLPPVL